MNHRTLLACAALLLALAPAPLRAGQADRTLDLYWIDSEGGGSTLIVTPAGESILIDTGNPGGRDAGRIRKVATEVAKLDRIDHVVITHFHVDHFGGLAELAALLPVGTLYDKGITEENPDTKAKDLKWTLASRPYREAKVGRRVTLAAGDSIPLKAAPGSPALSLRCLAANQKFISPAPDATPNAATPPANGKAPDTSDNANSVVLLLGFGGFRFFDGGDLTWNAEQRLVLPHNLPGRVDLYQVDHHGLDVSNNPVLVRSLDPVVAVMNNGPRKGTSAGAMEALRGAPSLQALYQVHENVRADRENNTDPERIANAGDLGEGCQAHYVACRVAPDGKSYTLSVPSRSHERRFQTRN